MSSHSTTARRNGASVTKSTTSVPLPKFRATYTRSPLLPTFLEASLLAIYPSTLVLGSLFSLLEPHARIAPYSATLQSHPPEFAPSYFAQKKNLFNVFFVKIGWFWTTLAFFIFLFLHPSTGPSRSLVLTPLRLQGFVRYCMVTLWWFVVTQWFFGPGLVDRSFRLTGGKCDLLQSEEGRAELGETMQYVTAAACKLAGGKWKGGHDISGHVFLLVLGSAFLWLEILPIVMKHADLREQRLIRRADGVVGKAEARVHSGSDGKDDSREATGGVSAPLAVAGLSWWMLLMTAAYFHTWFEKFTGLIVAFMGIGTVYFLPRAVPVMRRICQAVALLGTAKDIKCLKGIRGVPQQHTISAVDTLSILTHHDVPSTAHSLAGARSYRVIKAIESGVEEPPEFMRTNIAKGLEDLQDFLESQESRLARKTPRKVWKQYLRLGKVAFRAEVKEKLKKEEKMFYEQLIHEMSTSEHQVPQIGPLHLVALLDLQQRLGFSQDEEGPPWISLVARTARLRSPNPRFDEVLASIREANRARIRRMRLIVSEHQQNSGLMEPLSVEDRERLRLLRDVTGEEIERVEGMIQRETETESPAEEQIDRSRRLVEEDDQTSVDQQPSTLQRAAEQTENRASERSTVIGHLFRQRYANPERTPSEDNMEVSENENRRQPEAEGPETRTEHLTTTEIDASNPSAAEHLAELRRNPPEAQCPLHEQQAESAARGIIDCVFADVSDQTDRDVDLFNHHLHELVHVRNTFDRRVLRLAHERQSALANDGRGGSPEAEYLVRVQFAERRAAMGHEFCELLGALTAGYQSRYALDDETEGASDDDDDDDDDMMDGIVPPCSSPAVGNAGGSRFSPLDLFVVRRESGLERMDVDMEEEEEIRG